MITLKEWNERIDAFIEEENRSAGRVVPVHRIYCRDDSDRSGGGLYNETVTIDTIGRFARALGDSNPLYSDPMHPEAIQAPPLLECCICSTFIGGKMPRLRGVSVYDAGTKWERFYSIRPGDAFRAETAFLGVAEVTRPGSGDRLLLRSHKITLYNQRGETVSVLTARSLIKCLSPDKCLPPVPAEGSVTADAGSGREAVGLAKEQDSGLSAGLSYQGRPHYTEEELEQVYANLDAQFDGLFRRGTTPRFWEDVETGEELPEEIVGPYDESDGQALMAAIGAANAFATKWGTLRARKKHVITDPETGAVRHPVDRHSSDAAARAQGLPRALVSGIHSQALLAKTAGDWMGDAGFLRCLDCRCRRPLYFGDLSSQRGYVTGKEKIDGRFYVKLHLEAVRQDGVTHTEAEALVELPSRCFGK